MHQDVGFVPVLGAESSYRVLRLDWWGHQPGCPIPGYPTEHFLFVFEMSHVVQTGFKFAI